MTSAAAALVQLVVVTAVSLVAVSRAERHALSPVALVAVVGGVVASSTVIGWVNGLYAGATEALDDPMLPACSRAQCDEHGDPWAPRRMWPSSVLVAAGAAAWSIAAAGLVALVLDTRRAGWATVFVTLAGTSAVVAAAVDSAARHRGRHGARWLVAHPAPPAGVRRRAWADMAWHLGALQVLVNAAAAVLLFHDYSRHASGPHALTSSVVLADAPVFVVLVTVGLGLLLTPVWAAADARLGRVALDDVSQLTAGGPLGSQALVYVAAATLLLVPLVRWVLPESPTVLQTVLARAALTGVLGFAVSGAAYVRGACNALGAE
jgi:hypothetical protein